MPITFFHDNHGDDDDVEYDDFCGDVDGDVDGDDDEYEQDCENSDEYEENDVWLCC